MASGFTSTGSAELEKLAVAYREGGPKIRRRVALRLRNAATPLAQEVVAKGAEQMPYHGGLRARLATAKGGVTVSLRGRITGVSIRIANAEKDRIRAINRKGVVRHPVFGHSKTWSKTSVPTGAWSKEFEKGAPAVAAATQAAVREALAEIAREASSA